MKKLACLLFLLGSCATTQYTVQIKKQGTDIEAFLAWEKANQPKPECKDEVKVVRDKLATIIKSQGDLVLQMSGRKNGH